jgi:predicted acetyltransferase
MVEKTAPFAGYWHVKNYFRTEDATTGLILTAPAPLEFGLINYRVAIRKVIEHGFRSAFLVEHYGGDGLSISATNRDYLRRILPETPSRYEREATKNATS